MNFKTNDKVKLFNRFTGKLLGDGVIGRCEEKVISVRHEGGSATMLQGESDPFFRIEKV